MDSNKWQAPKTDKGKPLPKQIAKIEEKKLDQLNDKKTVKKC